MGEAAQPSVALVLVRTKFSAQAGRQGRVDGAGGGQPFRQNLPSIVSGDRASETGDGLGHQGRSQGRGLFTGFVGGGGQKFEATLEVVVETQQTVVADSDPAAFLLEGLEDPRQFDGVPVNRQTTLEFQPVGSTTNFEGQAVAGDFMDRQGRALPTRRNARFREVGDEFEALGRTQHPAVFSAVLRREVEALREVAGGGVLGRGIAASMDPTAFVGQADQGRTLADGEGRSVVQGLNEELDAEGRAKPLDENGRRHLGREFPAVHRPRGRDTEASGDFVDSGRLGDLGRNHYRLTGDALESRGLTRGRRQNHQETRGLGQHGVVTMQQVPVLAALQFGAQEAESFGFFFKPQTGGSGGDFDGPT